MAKIVLDLSKKTGYKKYKLLMETIGNIYTDKKLKDFIADKCIEELVILNNSLHGFGSGEEHDVFLQKVEEYKKNHKREIGEDYILLFNETNLSNQEMYWVSDKTKAKYPEGISISYIIEYGTGLLGESQEDWATNINNYGEKGWAYKKDDVLYRTKGVEGRFVYLKLGEIVEEKMNDWIEEYIKRKVGV